MNEENILTIMFLKLLLLRNFLRALRAMELPLYM